MIEVPINRSEDRGNLHTRMRPSIRKRIQIQAILEDRDLADVLEDAVMLYLESLEKKAAGGAKGAAKQLPISA